MQGLQTELLTTVENNTIESPRLREIKNGGSLCRIIFQLTWNIFAVLELQLCINQFLSNKKVEDF